MILLEGDKICHELAADNVSNEKIFDCKIVERDVSSETPVVNYSRTECET